MRHRRVGLAVGPTATPYAATTTSVTLNGTTSYYLIAAGQGGIGGNDFIVDRWYEQNGSGSSETSEVRDTSFGSNGTFSTDFGSTTANSIDAARGVAVEADGTILVSGYSAPAGTGNYQIALADLQWQNTFPVASGTGAVARATDTDQPGLLRIQHRRARIALRLLAGPSVL